MELHYFAIFGGFIGFLVTGLFLWNGEGDRTLFMIMGICVGVFLGYFVGALLEQYKKRGYVLVRKMKKLNPLRGKSINEVITAVGGYSSKQAVKISDRNNEVGAYYTFIDGEYEVQLLVGADDIIIGVTKEVLGNKKIV